MSFGIPYMGSKQSICKNICAIFPKADNFYDLFGGGFSITDCMIRHRSKDYKQFHFNEIRPGVCELIKDAIAGKYNYEVFKPKWISREDFFEKKDSDAYVKLLWSFGNNGKDYLFGPDIEEYKRSLHNAIIFNEFNDLALKMLGIKSFNDAFSIKDRRFFLSNRAMVGNKFKSNERLQQLERLEKLQKLEQLQQLLQFKYLSFYNGSYDQVEIKKDSIIYCDIPYQGTGEYDKSGTTFDRKAFLDWADMQNNPVFISEYQVNDNRFKQIFQISKRALFCQKKNIANKIEKLYANKAGIKKIFNKGN